MNRVLLLAFVISTATNSAAQDLRGQINYEVGPCDNIVEEMARACAHDTEKKMDLGRLTCKGHDGKIFTYDLKKIKIKLPKPKRQ